MSLYSQIYGWEWEHVFNIKVCIEQWLDIEMNNNYILYVQHQHIPSVKLGMEKNKIYT